MSSDQDPVKTIADLKLHNQRLVEQLKDNEKLLSRFMDIAHKQSQQISQMSASLQDTLPWDPLTCPRPSSCSTPSPGNQSSWVDVVVRGKQKSPPAAAPGPVLSNRYAALADGDVPASATAPDRQDTDPQAVAASSLTAPVGLSQSHSPAPRGNGIEHRETTRDSARRERVPARTAATTSSRRKLLKDAVRRRSGEGLPRCNQAESPALATGGALRPDPARSPPVSVNTAAAAALAQPPVSALPCPAPAAAATGHGSPGRAATSALPQPPLHPPQPSVSQSLPPPRPPRPLFSPTTLLVGDSIIRYCRLFNSKTHCLPGATVTNLLDKLPDILQAAPATITTIIIHVGVNDTSFRQSEITKIQFRHLFDFLARCGKTVFISGPLPTLGRGDVRFSRIQALHSWLKNFSSTYNYGYIDNFTLFWFRSSCYHSDGLHINPLGNRILTANITYAIHSHKKY